MHTDDEKITHDLEAAARAVRPRPAGQVLAEVHQRRRRRRRRNRAAQVLVATAVLAVAAAGVAGLASINRSDEVIAARGADGQEPSATAGAPTPLDQPESDMLRSAWRTLPSGPLGERLGFVSAWTGSELVIWGGGSSDAGGERYFSDGAAYDPARATWRTLAPAPGSGRADAKAVWTGDEVVVLGGRDANGVRSDGLAYDPKADSWRQVNAGPLGSSLPGDAVWTGSEVVVATASPGDAEGRPERVLTFDPSSGNWGERSDPPARFTDADLVVSGDRLLLFSGALDELGSATSPGVEVAEWDTRNRAWVSLPALPDLLPQAFVAEQVSDYLIAVDYRQTAFVSAGDDVDWSRLSPGPLDPSNCPPESAAIAGSLFVWQCGQAAIVGTGTEWINVTRPDSGDVLIRDTTIVFGGDSVLVWGRDFNARRPIFWELSISDLR